MRVLVIERNLLWSSRLRTGLVALGHDAVVVSGTPAENETADLAIVNLSQPDPEPRGLIEHFRKKSIKTIAHAGHKEKELLILGREAGADLLVTNGELSAKLEQVISRVL